jgi:hypothetical protein
VYKHHAMSVFRRRAVSHYRRYHYVQRCHSYLQKQISVISSNNSCRESIFWDVSPCSSVDYRHGVVFQKKVVFIVSSGGASNHLHIKLRPRPYPFQTPWHSVRKQTISTERPPLVGEVNANFCGIEGVA